MSTPQLRNELNKIIENADERFLKMVYAIAVAYADKNVVAHTTNGVPLTSEQYIAELSEAKREIKKGKTISHARVKAKVKLWGKK
jgi:hypothetical protein